jgi:hypothetical protein
LQIESHYAGVRDNATSWQRFGEAVAKVVMEFLGQH